MKRVAMNCGVLLVLLFPLLTGCDRKKQGSSALEIGTEAPRRTPRADVSPTSQNARPTPQTLADARQHFTTRLVSRVQSGLPVEVPPAGVFKRVAYDSSVGKLAAYLTVDPGDKIRHPAIVWISGGDCNTINDLWHAAPASNDQTAAAYRRAGIAMMFPSLRGGNDNPGSQEGFYGEVDDVIAAADFLARQPYVDPDRIYLGGHSTGGTLALLTAEYTNRFRAVFCFGPVDDIRRYNDGDSTFSFSMTDRDEVAVRSPINWLSSIQTPTFVLEGEVSPSNVNGLRLMIRRKPNSAFAHFFAVPGLSHFSLLAPANDLLASKIIADTGAQSNISVTFDEIDDLATRLTRRSEDPGTQSTK